MSDAPRAVWRDDHAVVADPGAASRLHNRHGVGAPQPGNALRLDAVETAWLLAAGRIALDGADLPGILASDHADIAFLCYRDLRERGLRVRSAGGAAGVVRGDEAAHATAGATQATAEAAPATARASMARFAVWPRGTEASAEPLYTVVAVGERDAVTPGVLTAAIGHVVAAVDEDGAVTYYEVREERPAGRVTMAEIRPLAGRLVGDHVLVTGDTGALAAEGAGTRHEAGTVLSLMEAAWLVRRGVLRVDADVEAEGERRQHHFARTWPVYLALRSTGVVPRSGFRFGTHLRAYDSLPDSHHARWLVDCLSPEDEPHWSRLSRGVRLAHGVRKVFLVAIAADPVRFVRLDWFRP